MPLAFRSGSFTFTCLRFIVPIVLVKGAGANSPPDRLFLYRQA